jgi:hypothetical protein
MSLTGRTWLINAVSFTVAGLIGIGALGGVWIYVNGLQGYFIAAAPWVMRLMLLLKAAVAAAVVGGMLRAGLIRPLDAAAMAGLWCLVTGSLYVAAWRLLPGGLAPLTTVAAGIILAVPFSRLAGAPLALHWNRHR